MKKSVPSPDNKFSDLPLDETNRYNGVLNEHTIEGLCEEQNDQSAPVFCLESPSDLNGNEERGQPFQPKLSPLTQVLLKKMTQLPSKIQSFDPVTLTNIYRCIILLKMIWPTAILLQIIYAIIIVLLLVNSMMNRRK